MPTHDAEGIVLRQYRLGDSDRIIVFFTRERGKLRGVAPGVKKTKSRLGACLEPLNHVHLRYYLKEGAELARVIGCELIHSYLGRNTDPLRFYGFSYVAELAGEMVQDNNSNPVFFRLVLAALDAAEKEGVCESWVRYYEFWTLRLSGLLPDYEYCSSCGKCVKEEGFFAAQDSGAGYCGGCSNGVGIRIGPTATGLLSRMKTVSPEVFARLALHSPANRELERLLQKLFDLHLERRLNSYNILLSTLRERVD